MAAHLNEYFNPFSPVKAESIITGAGLTAIHELIGYSLADPGDAILVSRPVYGRFELDFGNTSGLSIVYANMDEVDPFSPEAVPKYQEAFDMASRNGVLVKALLIVNPHNPLGVHNFFIVCFASCSDAILRTNVSCRDVAGFNGSVREKQDSPY